MDVLIGWTKKEFKFNGEIITAELRPLKRSAMLLLSPYISMGEEKEQSKLMATALELQELAEKIFPEHVRNIENLTVNGNPVKVEELAEESVFCALVGSIISTLSIISSLTTDQAKNSEGLSGTRISEDPATNE